MLDTPEFYRKHYTQEYFKPRSRTRNLTSLENDFLYVKKFVSPSSRILDYGCGEMFFSALLEKEYTINVYDPSPLIQSKPEYQSYNNIIAHPYDCIILRGVLQHLPDPFITLEKLSSQLAVGSKIIFLATPNTSSPYYLLNSELPFLDRPRNFWIPSKHELSSYLVNLNMRQVHVSYPYLHSGYAQPIRDHLKFILNLFGKSSKYPFWRSSMNLVFEKY